MILIINLVLYYDSSGGEVLYSWYSKAFL